MMMMPEAFAYAEIEYRQKRIAESLANHPRRRRHWVLRRPHLRLNGRRRAAALVA